MLDFLFIIFSFLSTCSFRIFYSMTMISTQARIFSWISGPYILVLNRYLHLYILKIPQSSVSEMISLSVLSSYIFFLPISPAPSQAAKSKICKSSQAHSSSSPFLLYIRVIKVIWFQSYESLIHIIFFILTSITLVLVLITSLYTIGIILNWSFPLLSFRLLYSHGCTG